MKLIKHQLVLLFMTMLSGFVWLQMGLYLLHELTGYNPDWGYLQYCVGVLPEQSVFHQVVFVGLNIMMIYSFGMAIWIIGKQMVLSKRWSAFVRTFSDETQSQQMNRKFPGFGSRIIVVREEGILALTFGFFRPKIVVSTSLIEHFNDHELTAILWHEWSHCSNYDPLRLLFVKAMRYSLPYIPVLRYMERYIQIWVELHADQKSVDRMKSAYPLASAILKGSRTMTTVPSGVGFANQAINFRLKQLIEPHSSIRVPFLVPTPFMFSATVVVLLTSVVISGCS
jgi:beta-lactamase regulating signal transducer with metallopeptidase domain